MIQFACHTWAFNDLSLSDALGTIARMGFRYVDIGSGPHLNVAQIAKDPRGMATKVRDDLTAFNLKLSDLYLMLPRISLEDDEQRQKDIDTYNALLPFIVALEAPGVTLSPGLVHNEDDEDAYKRTVESLTEMLEGSRTATPATHLRVSIEPHIDSMAQKPERAIQLVKDVDGLELTVDWAHLVCQGIDHATITSLLPYARHIQIRQAAQDKLQTPFDAGEIDPQAVIDALADYDGVLCVEYMKTKSLRHGMVEVNAITESIALRDALRNARDESITSTAQSESTT